MYSFTCDWSLWKSCYWRESPSYSQLVLPTSPGLNSFNFLLSAGQTPAGLALPPNSIPTMQMPYILVPSAALPHYPLVAGSLQKQVSDAHNKLNFSLPAVMSPAQFMVGPGAFGFAAASDIGRSLVPPPSTPEQSRIYSSATGAPQSPAASCHAISINTPEPLVRNFSSITSTNLWYEIFSHAVIIKNDLLVTGTSKMPQHSLTLAQSEHLFCWRFLLIYSSKHFVCHSGPRWLLLKLLNRD